MVTVASQSALLVKTVLAALCQSPEYDLVIVATCSKVVTLSSNAVTSTYAESQFDEFAYNVTYKLSTRLGSTWSPPPVPPPPPPEEEILYVYHGCFSISAKAS